MDYKNATTLQEVFDRMKEVGDTDLDTDDAERTARSLLADCVRIFGTLTGKQIIVQDILEAFYNV